MLGVVEDSSFVCPSFRDLPVSVQVASGVQHASPASFHDPSFEFFSGHLSATDDDPPELGSADEIFLRGKFLPLKPAPSTTQKVLPFFHRRRSEYRDGIDRPRRLAAESRKFRRAPSESDRMVPLSPKPAATGRTPGSPRWYLLALGSVRVPAAMEMRDIRSRQRQRLKSPTARGGGEWWCDGKKAWKLLRSLSCRRPDTSDVATAAPPSGFFSHFRCPNRV